MLPRKIFHNFLKDIGCEHQNQMRIHTNLDSVKELLPSCLVLHLQSVLMNIKSYTFFLFVLYK